MCPTRELAQQVMREIEETVPGRFRGVCLYGGQSYRESNNALRQGVDYVVATPGRLMDNLKSGHLDFSGIEYFVLDEADQMLDMGFSDDVEEVLGYIENKAQTLLFSATMPSWVKSLADRYTEDPVTIDLVGDTKQKAASTIDFKALAIPGRKGGEQRDAKASILTNVIATHSDANTIVFVNTKAEADSLAAEMGRSSPARRCTATSPSSSARS